MAGVNDTVVEVCCSEVIVDGVEKGDDVLKKVLGCVKTKVTGKR